MTTWWVLSVVVRFAEFLSGVDHVSPEERVNYERHIMEDSDLHGGGELLITSSTLLIKPSLPVFSCYVHITSSVDLTCGHCNPYI